MSEVLKPIALDETLQSVNSTLERVAKAIEDGGGGGSAVTWDQDVTEGTKIATITIDGEETEVFAPDGEKGSSVEWQQNVTEGTEIAEITIDGETTKVYAPTGGGGSSTDYSTLSSKPQINGETLLGNKTASQLGLVPSTRTVNGKALSSDVTLGASDVGALPNDTQIPTEQTVANWGFTKNTGTYTKPDSGIPETDLDSSLKQKIANKIDKPTEATEGQVLTYNGESWEAEDSKGGSDEFIGTRAEWDALPQTEKDKYHGKVVNITDDYESNICSSVRECIDSKNNPNNVASANALAELGEFSTTKEMVVGTWINNKPIYRKVLVGTLSNSTYTSIGSISNLDEIVSTQTVYFDGNSFVSGYLNNAYYSGIFATQASGKIEVYHPTQASGKTVKAIIEYTKTTD